MHNIGNIDRHESTTQAWHGLSKVSESLSLSDNWLTRWDIKAEPTYRVKHIGGAQVAIPTGHAILQCTDDDTISVGDPFNPETYKPIDNEAFLGLIKDSIGGTDHELVSVGSVRNRGRVFATLKLVGLEDFSAGGKEFKTYLNFGNGHDKSSALWVNTSNTCTVCDNTFSANLMASSANTGIRERVRHTKNAMLKFPAIAKLIDQAVGVQAKFQREFEQLSQQSISKDSAVGWMTGFVFDRAGDKKDTPQKRDRIDQLVHLFEAGRGNIGETRADVFSAITEFYTHHQGRDKNKQFFTSEYGSGATHKRVALDKLVDNDEYHSTVYRGFEVISNRKAQKGYTFA